MALSEEIEALYRCLWKENAFSNIPIILSWDEDVIEAWLLGGPKVENYPKLLDAI